MFRFYFFLLLLLAGFFLIRTLIRNILKHPLWQHTQQQSANHEFKGKMTTDEAYEVLGLKQDASKQDILTAHRKLMQKLHPDHGGSDYLAAKINLAKHTLLKNHR